MHLNVPAAKLKENGHCFFLRRWWLTLDIRSPQSARPTRIINGVSLCAEAAPNWNWGIECTCVPPLGIQLNGWIVSFTEKEMCAKCGMGVVSICLCVCLGVHTYLNLVCAWVKACSCVCLFPSYAGMSSVAFYQTEEILCGINEPL